MHVRVNVTSFGQAPPPGVKRMARNGRKLYLLLEDNSVIQYDTKFSFVEEWHIPAHEDVQCCLAVVRGRVLVGSASGIVYLCDFPNRQLVQLEQLFGGTITHMEPTKDDSVLIACQDCVVRIYSLNEETDQLELSSTFKRQHKHPIICLSHLDGVVAAGSTEALLLFTYDVANPVNTSSDVIKLPKSQNSIVDITIRAVLTLDTSTCVTGDSIGRTTFWDVGTSTVICSFTSHLRAITNMASCGGAQRVAVAGVDPQVVLFNRRADGSYITGMVFKRVKHEVTGLFFCPKMNSLIVTSKFPAIHFWGMQSITDFRVCQILPRKLQCRVAADARLVLIPHENKLCVYKLGASVDSENTTVGALALKEDYDQLLTIQLPGSHKLDCVAISDDGRWICYSSASPRSLLRLFSVSEDGRSVEKQPIRLAERVASICFSRSSHHLIIVSQTGSIRTFDLVNGGQPQVLETGQTVRWMRLSENSMRCAMVCGDKKVRVFDLDTNEEVAELPGANAALSTLAFTPSDHILALYSNYRVAEFDLKRQKYTKWCDNFMHNPDWDALASKHYPSTPLSLICLAGGKIVFSLDKCFVCITKESRKRDSNSEPVESGGKWTVVDTWQHTRNICQMSDSEFVLFQLRDRDIFRVLPPTVMRKVFEKDVK